MSITTHDRLAQRGLFYRLAGLGGALSVRRREAREFAQLESFNDHALRDIGLRRETDSRQGRHLLRS